MSAIERIKQQVDNNPIIIYMKGTPQLPQCGFSSRAAEALKQCGKEFAYVNVLMDSEVFRDLPQAYHWPTFPQIFIQGKLVGGCDILLELHENGELKKMVNAVDSGDSDQ